MTSQSILLYLFKMILVAGIFYGYYWYLLRDKKFHHYNRFYLLSTSLFSLIIPCLQLSWFTIKQENIIASDGLLAYVLNNKEDIIQSKSILTVASLVLLLLAIGAVYLLIKLCYNLYKIYRLKRKAEVVSMDGFDFINTAEEEAPFSFLNNLFWKNSISLEAQSGQQIFKHELTHIQEKHTWDRLYCQFVSCLFWMNPFNWLIQNELETIHEFIADEAAIGSNNTAAFAQMLLETHYGHHFLNPSHSFFYASIKRRLANLTAVQHSKFNYARKLMGMPLLLLVLVVFAIKVNSEERIKKELKHLDEVTVQNVVSNIRFDSIPKEKHVKKNLASKSKITQSLKTAVTITKLVEPLQASLAILDGTFVTLDKINQLNPTSIKTLNVLDGMEAVDKYGNKAKYGAIEVESNTAIKKMVMMRVTNVKKEDQVNPLYVLNGVAVESIAFDSLQTTDIKAIHIRKDVEARKMFGDKGSNGVIFITTKWQ
jgi:beta-lactamase regulating signal transducer with metallopeptidase domain